MSNKFPFSQWLRAEMRKRGWKQADIVHSAHLKPAAVYKLINARCQPKPATLQAISSAFDLPVETVYRAAGLLPPITGTEYDEKMEQAIYLFCKIKDPQRRKVAIQVLKVLASEEVNPQTGMISNSAKTAAQQRME